MDEMDEIELQTLEAEVALVTLRDMTEFETETAHEKLIATGISDLADAVLALYKCAIMPIPPSQPFVFGPWLWPREWPGEAGRFRFRALGRTTNSDKHVYYSVFIYPAYKKRHWYIAGCANDSDGLVRCACRGT